MTGALMGGRIVQILRLKVPTLVIDRYDPMMNTAGMPGDYLIIDGDDAYVRTEPELVNEILPLMFLEQAASKRDFE